MPELTLRNVTGDILAKMNLNNGSRLVHKVHPITGPAGPEVT